jgi:hypothetical protein
MINAHWLNSRLKFQNFNAPSSYISIAIAKSKFLLFSIILLPLFSISQNVTKEYYKLLNQANSNYYITKDSNAALLGYIKAFDLAENKLSVLSPEIRLRAILLAATLNNYKIVQQMFFDAIEDGMNLESIQVHKRKHPELNGFFNSEYAMALNTEYTHLRNTYSTERDVGFEDQLLTFFELDMFARNISGIPNIGKYATDKKLFGLIISYSDCDMRPRLLSLLQSKNMDEKLRDNRAMGFLTFLMTHNLRNFELNPELSLCSDTTFYQSVQPILLHFVLIGKLINLDYAYCIDRAQCWNNSGANAYQIYGTHFTKIDGKKVLTYPIKDIANVDKRRAEIFLPSLYEASIIENFQLPLDYEYKK